MKRFHPLSISTFLAVSLLCGSLAADPVTSAFTYQGRLGDAGQPANGHYDLQFSLRDAATGGGLNAGPVVMEDVNVQNGLFTVTLDFGEDAFSEGARWMEIGVRPGAETASFTLLSPRQAVTAAPLAVQALHSVSAGVAQTALAASSAAVATNATKAATADAVAWNHVTGLPPGIADGVDNDTTYSAGPGLTLGAANEFALNFAGSGTLNTVARSDHGRFGAIWSGTSSTRGLTVQNLAADGSGARFRQGSGSGYDVFGGNVPAGVIGDSQHGDGIFGATAAGNRAGVVAMGSGASGTALQISRGALRAGSGGPVFVHEVTAANNLTSTWTVVDHPLCNGRPDAILIVTPRSRVWSADETAPVKVLYNTAWGPDSAKNKWFLIPAPYGHIFHTGDSYNVLVINRND